MTERKGFIGWLKRLFRRPEPLAAQPVTEAMGPVAATLLPEVTIEPPGSAEPLRLPARGEVFELHVLADFKWTSSQLSRAALEEWVSAHTENARYKVQRELWDVARGIAAIDTAEAEVALNEKLRKGWCYESESGTVRCQPSIRVRLDPRLAERLLPFEYRELNMNEEHRLGLLKAELTEILSKAWMKSIKLLETADDFVTSEEQAQFLAPFSAALADAEFAAVMTQLAQKRRQLTVELKNVLDDARKGHEQIGLFEFASAYDRAVQAYSRQMGLDPYALVFPEAAAGGTEAPA
jgi:hypothetical protein